MANIMTKPFKSVIKQIGEIRREISVAPAYRLVNIEKDAHGEYQATIQVTRKSITFTAKPEELLADDSVVDLFSPRDIRTLTYLGYLGINGPKYKILAKQLAEDSDQMVFAVQKRGSSKVEVKTADEISTNDELLESLDQKDAHMVGYTTATEQTLKEKDQMAALRAQAEAKKKQSK